MSGGRPASGSDTIPAYVEYDSEAACAIRDEHDAIRKLLLRIGVEVELHQVRVPTLQALIDKLHAHAAREDESMYPWAQAHLPTSTKRRLFARIGRSLRALVVPRAAMR